MITTPKALRYITVDSNSTATLSIQVCTKFSRKKFLTASASLGFHHLLPFHEVRTIDNRGTEVAKFGTEEPPGGIIWY